MLRQLLKDTAIYGAGDFVFKFISFAIFPIYAHTFAVADFGKMELVLTLAGLAGLFVNPGLNNSTQRFYWDADTKEEDRPLIVSSGLWMLGAWSLGVTTILLVVIYTLTDFIQAKYQLAWILILLALLNNVPTQIVQYSMDTLRLHFAPWKYTMLSATRNILAVALCLSLVVGIRLGLVGFFWGNLIAMTITVPVALWSIRRDLRFKVDLNYCRILFKYGYPFIFAGMAYWIFGSLDRWMLGTMADTTQVGLFSIAYKFAMIVFFVNGAFGQAWSPFAIKIYAERPDYRQIFSRIFSFWFFGLTVLGAVITLFAFELLYFLTPPAYWPAANIIGFTVMGVVLLGTTQITVLGISLEKKTHLLASCAWITALVNFLFNLLLIPHFGALGSAISTLAAYLSLTGIYLYLTQKLHPIPLDPPKLLFSVAVMTITLMAANLFNSHTWTLWIVAGKCATIMAILASAYMAGLIPLRVLKKIVRENQS